jgi:hypothetical protein
MSPRWAMATRAEGMEAARAAPDSSSPERQAVRLMADKATKQKAAPAAPRAILALAAVLAKRICMVRLTPDSVSVESSKAQTRQPGQRARIRGDPSLQRRPRRRRTAPGKTQIRKREKRMPEKARFTEPAGQRMKSLRLRWRTPEQWRSKAWGNLGYEHVAERPAEGDGGD